MVPFSVIILTCVTYGYVLQIYVSHFTFILTHVSCVCCCLLLQPTNAQFISQQRIIDTPECFDIFMSSSGSIYICASLIYASFPQTAAVQFTVSQNQAVSHQVTSVLGLWLLISQFHKVIKLLKYFVFSE